MSGLRLGPETASAGHLTGPAPAERLRASWAVAWGYFEGAFGAVVDKNTTNGGLNMAFFIGNTSLTLIAVPEPSTYAGLAGLAMLGFAFWRRRGGPAA